MKSNLLLSVILATLLCGSLFGQSKSNYDVQGFAGPDPSGQNYISGASSTYFFGKTWLFFWEYLHPEWSSPTWNLKYGTLNIDADGYVEDSYFGTYESFFADSQSKMNVNSCIISNNLFVCYYIDYAGDKYLEYGVQSPEGGAFQKNSKQVSFETDQQIAIVGIKDTLYFIYVDKNSKLVKYHRGILDQHTPPNLHFIESTANVISTTLKSAGNVSACHFTTNDTVYNQLDKIMIAFAAESSDKSSNEIFVYSGIQDQFNIFTSGTAVSNYPCTNVSIEQGSVKGGMEKSYVFQLGYSNNDESNRMYRCEFGFEEKQFSSWHHITYEDTHPMQDFSGFASYYNKGSNKREKHLYLMFKEQYSGGISAFHWKSDRLIHFGGSDDRTGTPENHQAAEYYDLIMVVEGAPPYALNGNELNSCTPTSVVVGKSSTTEVSVSSKYTQTVEASMGYGPVTAGFSASFQESSGSSQSKTISISYTLTPPEIDEDSAGFMWYYCTAPEIKREQWRLCDYNGDKIEPERSLFFFSITDLFPRWLKTSLSMFAKSPKPYEIHSYDSEKRNVQGWDFVENSGQYIAQVDVDGINGSTIYLEWDKNKTNSFTQDYEVSLSVEGSVLDIFDVSAGLSAGFEFEKSRTTTVTKSIEINYQNPAPVWDTTHGNFVHGYLATNYILQTTDTSAYYLDSDWKKDYSPYFITYEVGGINMPPFGIAEDNQIKEKYRFSNYPNPCMDQSFFQYKLADQSYVNFSLYNQFGQLISNELDHLQPAGIHSMEYNTSDLPGGVYFYRFIINEDVITGKIIKQ